MTGQSDTEDWVDLTETETSPTANLATVNLAAYAAFVSNGSNPAPVFKAAGLCFTLRYPNAFGEKAKTVAKSHFKCNACTHRAGIYCRDLGPAGPVFFHNLNTLASPCVEIEQLRALAIKTCAQEVAKPELIIVTSSTYAPIHEGHDPSGKPYAHWTIMPAQVSEPTAAARFECLRTYYGQMDTRLAKLTVPEAVTSVAIMVEEQAALERPTHYESVLRWVSHVQALAVGTVDGGCSTGDGSFEAMSVVDQAKLRVHAIMHGRADGATHLDFHQAENIVDFLTMPSRDALRAEMDRRSDPQSYMVSQLNRRLAAEGITSKHLIGLMWDGAYTDDLDIHVRTPSGKQIYYGNKAADGCRLDFDANVSKGEANPCENVSCKPGTFTVQVNNFTRRTMSQPVPFQIVCRQAGMADVVYDGVWGVNRQKGDLITVCKHTFTEVAEGEATEMSANAAARAKALDAEWTAKVGDPTATIATLDSLTDKYGVSVVVCGSGRGGAPTAAAATEPASVGRAFMDMAAASTNAAAAAKASATTAKNGKAFLSQAAKKLPSTVSDLIAHLKASPSASLSIDLRDHAPGYLVDIATKTDGVRKSDVPAPCHFHNKHAYPVKPVAGTVGNARLDATWLGAKMTAKTAGSGALNRLVKVHAVVDVAGGCPFLALHGAKLPPASPDAFPLAAGFYPTDLAADFHAHRERWTFCHTQMRPSMPPARTVPMVGAFLTGEASVVYLDGVKLTVKAG